MGITKAPFITIFKDKLNVGYAVVDERIAPSYINTWKNLSTQGVHVIDAISDTLRCIALIFKQETIHLGCSAQ